MVGLVVLINSRNLDNLMVRDTSAVAESGEHWISGHGAESGVAL